MYSMYNCAIVLSPNNSIYFCCYLLCTFVAFSSVVDLSCSCTQFFNACILLYLYSSTAVSSCVCPSGVVSYCVSFCVCILCTVSSFICILLLGLVLSSYFTIVSLFLTRIILSVSSLVSGKIGRVSSVHYEGWREAA